jgi:hypothetical protein
MMGIQIIIRQFGDLHEPGQQGPAATGRAKHQAGTARSAARPESGAADACSPAKSLVRGRAKANSERPPSSVGFSLSNGSEVGTLQGWQGLQHGNANRARRGRSRLIQIHIYVAPRGAFGPRQCRNRGPAGPALLRRSGTGSEESDSGSVERVLSSLRRLTSSLGRKEKTFVFVISQLNPRSLWSKNGQV